MHITIQRWIYTVQCLKYMNWPLQWPSFKRRSGYSSYSSSEPEYSSPYSWKYFFCRAFVTGNWNTLLFVPFLFVEMTLKGSKQGVIAMHWRRSFSAPYYWAISYCHLGLRTRSRFRTLILNNPKFYHCCISWPLPEVRFFFTNEVFWFSPAPSFADDPDKTKTTPKTLGGAKADEEEVRQHQNRGSCWNFCKNENIQMLKRVGGNSHLQFPECVVTAIGFCLARWRVIIGFHAFQLKHQVTSWIYSTIALRHLVHRMHWICPSLHGL